MHSWCNLAEHFHAARDVNKIGLKKKKQLYSQQTMFRVTVPKPAAKQCSCLCVNSITWLSDWIQCSL